jgi:hypothetical protein
MGHGLARNGPDWPGWPGLAWTAHLRGVLGDINEGHRPSQQVLRIELLHSHCRHSLAVWGAREGQGRGAWGRGRRGAWLRAACRRRMGGWGRPPTPCYPFFPAKAARRRGGAARSRTGPLLLRERHLSVRVGSLAAEAAKERARAGRGALELLHDAGRGCGWGPGRGGGVGGGIESELAADPLTRCSPPHPWHARAWGMPAGASDQRCWRAHREKQHTLGWAQAARRRAHTVPAPPPVGAALMTERESSQLLASALCSNSCPRLAAHLRTPRQAQACTRRESCGKPSLLPWVTARELIKRQ